MTATAFQALYIHWNKLKTRPEVEIVLSIPVEYADVVYQVLGGMPNPSEQVWVGCARLDPKVGFDKVEGPGSPSTRPTTPTDATPDVGEEPAPDPQPPARVSNNEYAKKAGRLGNDVRFQKFIEERFGPRDDPDLPTWAAAKVRELCGVATRADIKPDTPAGDRFDRLVWAYEAELMV